MIDKEDLKFYITNKLRYHHNALMMSAQKNIKIPGHPNDDGEIANNIFCYVKVYRAILHDIDAGVFDK